MKDKERTKEQLHDWGECIASITGGEWGWGAQVKDMYGNYSHFGSTTGRLIDLISGMYVMQSVWDVMTEQQQQNLMNSHGGVVDNSTEEITQQFEKGGYVPSTSAALVHGGEYVVPRGGTLVKGGGMPDVTINLTVNNGTQKDSRALADEISRILATEIRRMVKT